jgi:hypothetical protein
MAEVRYALLGRCAVLEAALGGLEAMQRPAPSDKAGFPLTPIEP